jgi:hypothetical protein
MKKKNLLKKIGNKIKENPFRFILYLVLISALIFVSIPQQTDLFLGDSIREEHKNEVIGNETNPIIIANKYTKWANDNIFAPYSYYNNATLGNFYKIDNRSFVFLRSTSAPYIIKSKLGNCGEYSYYFIDMMNYSKIPARVLCVIEDHCWVEYKVGEYWLGIDISNNKSITNKKEFANSRNGWSYIYATHLNGKVEDVTEDYLSIEKINFNYNGSEFMKIFTYSTINSIYLMENSKQERYNHSILIQVKTYGFNEHQETKIGINNTYLVRNTVSFLFFRFTVEDRLYLNETKNYVISPKNIMFNGDLKFNPEFILNFILKVTILFVTLFVLFKITLKVLRNK